MHLIFLSQAVFSLACLKMCMQGIRLPPC